MVKPYKYAGVLALPIGNAHWQAARKKAGADDKVWKDAAAEAKAIDERLLRERLVALFEDCGVSLDNPWGLVLKLAERHVPGFSQVRSRGRGQPPKGPDYDLFHQMDRLLKTKKDLSVRSAARIVARKRKRGETVAAIERRYRRTIKQIDKIAPQFRKMWEGQVIADFGEN